MSRYQKRVLRLRRHVLAHEEKDLGDKTVKDLRILAREKGIERYSDMKKDELIKALEG